MGDRQFLIINDKYAIAFDKHQWIVQRGTNNRKTGGINWSGVKFVATNKHHLFKCLLQEGCPSELAYKSIAGLPETFLEFLAAHNDALSRSNNDVDDDKASA